MDTTENIISYANAGAKKSVPLKKGYHFTSRGQNGVFLPLVMNPLGRLKAMYQGGIKNRMSQVTLSSRMDLSCPLKSPLANLQIWSPPYEIAILKDALR